MIKIEHLFKKFGKNEVLKDLSLFFDSKGIFAILGPNGSGKTTLIKCLLYIRQNHSPGNPKPLAHKILLK